MAYTRFSPDDIVLSSELVSTPIWSGDKTTLHVGDDMSTNPNQLIGLSADYYIDVYNNGGNGEVQFAIAYADDMGSGSCLYDPDVPGMSPSRTNYGQYRTLVLGDEETGFYFGDSSVSSSYFWAISIDRARYKEKLMVGSGSFFLNLVSESVDITLTEDSTIAGSDKYIDSGRVYNVRKIEGNALSTGSYGYYLPDIGTILIDGRALANEKMFDVTDVRWTQDPIEPVNKNSYDNADLFRQFIKSFTLKSEETITSNYVFVRAKNSQFNYSVNPSNLVGSGELRWDVMINSPETYITSVGLYNDNNDLLAIAKLSRPLPKNFNKEALIRVKLDY